MMPERTITKLFQKWDYEKYPVEICGGGGGESVNIRNWLICQYEI